MELKNTFKVFFIDIGVRNAIVDIYKKIEERTDRGSIFENVFLCERVKQGTLETFPPEIMFWRTRQGLEIDIIEKKGEEISAYECKWNNENKYYNDGEKAAVTVLELFIVNVQVGDVPFDRQSPPHPEK